VVAALLASAGLLAADPGSLTLERLLASDPRGSAASCANQDYPRPIASAQAKTPGQMVAPPNPGGQTRVDVFLLVLEIDEIEAQTNSFRFEGYGGMVWCDPARAFEGSEDRRVFYREGAERALDGFWWPGIILPWQLGTPELSNEELVVYSDGTARFSVKFNSRMSARYDFANFPLDRQTLTIPLQAFLWGTADVVMGESVGLSGVDPRFEMPEWELVDVRTGIYLEGDEGDGSSYSRFRMDIEISREVGFYLWKIALPLMMIVGVAWAVFWMSRDSMAQRQRMSATGLLTVVAYQFVATATLPRVPYLTLLDGVMLWSFFAIASTLVFNIRHNRKYRRCEEEGLQADRRMRWLFPLIYLAGVSLVAVVTYWL
jgi:hypothetical protein